jgi:phosphatidylglycerol:prolipoprotein diacylglycerol transferase
MLPEIQLGPLTLQTFGICFALGFLAAFAIISRRMRELRWPAEHASEMTGAALVGGLVGAKLYFVVDTGRWDDLLTGTGLTWYGGALGGALGVLLWARLRGHLNLVLLDLASVPLALGYAIGRVGCQFAGDGDYGKPWDGPWAMSYPDGTVPTTDRVHPTPVYETLTMALVAWMLWRLRDRFVPGALFGIYLVCAGLERFLVEFVRRNQDEVAGLTVAQLTSLAIVAGGAAWLGVLARRGGLSARASAAGTAG